MNPKLNMSVEALKKHIQLQLSDPALDQNTLFLYFTCDRDPVASEPIVDEIGIPSDWPFWWWNTTSNQWFMNLNATSGSMQWGKWAFGDINTMRTYSASGISLNTARQPNSMNDTFVVASINQDNVLLSTTTCTAEVSANNSTWVAVGNIGDTTGVASNKTSTISFLVPVGYYYKLVSSVTGSGTVTLVSCNELTM